ncbi:hypothetical protein HOD20_08550 [archaeon]|jgi:hypothetical protein|nr:hypothetical protein [archaeon]MBT4352559.1 hypothetical protein [archaeon]MBT4648580.1 hypothetical protein [archaeon]MBT6821417.1 hypothetical protein [archaeon]MBT7393012.1 hypothetical protein [archaeon]
MPTKKKEEKKKKIVKKKIKKKTVTKKAKLVNAKPNEYFMLKTGNPIKNLKEFVDSLENMNDWVFKHHVSLEKNDFSKWIADVLKEKELAQQLKKTDSQVETQLLTMRYMINKYI